MNARATTIARPAELTEKWYIVDASGQVLGRIAARIASILRGKKLANYTPHVDHKIHVIVTNADKVVLTADKMKTKLYRHHSGWMTGLKVETAEHLMDRRPTEVLTRAVQGMLPKGALGRQLNRHLRVYAEGEYKGQHDAQKPEAVVLKTRQPKKSL